MFSLRRNHIQISSCRSSTSLIMCRNYRPLTTNDAFVHRTSRGVLPCAIRQGPCSQQHAGRRGGAPAGRRLLGPGKGGSFCSVPPRSSPPPPPGPRRRHALTLPGRRRRSGEPVRPPVERCIKSNSMAPPGRAWIGCLLGRWWAAAPQTRGGYLAGEAMGRREATSFLWISGVPWAGLKAEGGG